MSDLKKKYYDGFQVHKIINEELDDGKIIMRILARFADEPSAEPENLQPTCNQLATDCISRRAAVDALIEWYGCKPNDIEVFEEIIEALPSVQPGPKRGKWIVHPEVKNVYGGTYIECSQCGEKYVVQHMEDEKYCRNCGAKMGVEK